MKKFIVFFFILSLKCASAQIEFGPEFEFSSPAHYISYLGTTATTVGLSGVIITSNMYVGFVAGAILIGYIMKNTPYSFTPVRSRVHQWVDNFVSKRAQKKFINEIKRRARKRGEAVCIKEIRHQSYAGNGDAIKVQYRDGFWFAITFDPAVIEVKMQPMSIAETEKQIGRIQGDIFEASKAAGLKPPSFEGMLEFANGGHINIGYEPNFYKNPTLFLNFIIDLINHWELSEGALLKDPYNSKTFIFNEQAMFKLQSWIKIILDAGEINEQYMRWFAYKFGKEFKNTFSISLASLAENYSRKFQRIEIRSLRSQKSAYHYLALLRLFQARIQYLKKYKEIIPIEFPQKRDRRNIALKINRFRRYVEEVGLPWRTYRRLLPRAYRKFLIKQRSKMRSVPANNVCEGVFNEWYARVAFQL